MRQTNCFGRPAPTPRGAVRGARCSVRRGSAGLTDQGSITRTATVPVQKVLLVLGLDNDHGGVPCMAPTCALPLPDQRAVRAFRVTATSVVGQRPPAEQSSPERWRAMPISDRRLQRGQSRGDDVRRRRRLSGPVRRLGSSPTLRGPTPTPVL